MHLLRSFTILIAIAAFSSETRADIILGIDTTDPSLIVTTADDTLDPTDGQTSLREAIAYAATLPAEPVPVILFNDGSVAGAATDFHDATPDTIELPDGQLVIGSSMRITGPGAGLLTLRNTAPAGPDSRVLRVTAGTVRLSGMTISGGNQTFSNADASGGGGGIFNQGDLTVLRCVISDNAVTFTGSGLGNSGRGGGGIRNFEAGSLTLIESAIVNNTVTGGSGGGLDQNSGACVIVNCTISGNRSHYEIAPFTFGRGGGISVRFGTLDVIGSTIAFNSAGGNQGFGGGISLDSEPGRVTMNLRNSIVAQNTVLGSVQQGPDIEGPVNSLGHNLIGDTAGATITGTTDGNLLNTDPLLGPLQDNGGPTPTHALLAGSPAINAGTTNGSPATDQRGIARPQSGAVDIGAYEQSPFDTGRKIVELRGAYWYLGPEAVGNDLRIYREEPGQVPVWVDGGLAVRIGQAADGTVLVQNFDSSVFARPGSALAQMLELTQTFNNPTPAAGDNFGNSVAISGNDALIGAPLDDTGASDAGSAYLLDATTGNLLQTFNSPAPASGDQFGRSVAISGNHALIGAQFDDTGASNAGSAYLFDTTTGTLLQTFNNPNPAFNNLFGFSYSVAISGNHALIGAPQDSTGAENAGSAYLFDATTGNLLQTFNNPYPAINDFFGWSVAISGNHVLIGAGEDDTVAENAGSAYLFDATTGDLLQTFNIPNPERNDLFGRSVAISGNHVLIGATGDRLENATILVGSAFLFDATTGSLLQTFNNPNPDSGDRFGSSVAISGNNALIGAERDDTGATRPGSAYLFDITTGTLLQTFNNPTPASNDFFGDSVAISGNKALIGATFDDTGAGDAGSAYLYAEPVPGPIGTEWLQRDSVVAGDGATWFLGPDGDGSDFTIYRWATDGEPESSGGAGVQLFVAADGTVLKLNAAGEYYRRTGSDTGLGSVWEGQAVPVITSVDTTTFTVGVSGSFYATATGIPVPDLALVGDLPDGVTFDPASGELSGTPAAGTAGTYPLTVTAGNGIGSDATQNFTLTVEEGPAVTRHPVAQVVCVGDEVSFMADATGFPVPEVRWQVSLNGGGYTDIPLATSPTLTLTGVTSALHRNRYRAVFTNTVSSVLTEPALLTILQAPSPTLDPQNQAVGVGEVVTFSALADGLFAGSAPSMLSAGERLLPNQVLLSPNHGYQLIYQSDGNLVLYGGDGLALWASGTAGQTPGEALMQTDGNFVIYSPNGLAQWSSATFGNPGSELRLQDNGDLVIYDTRGTPIFASGTGSQTPGLVPSVQWQVSTDDGATFADIPGANGLTLSFTVSLADHNTRYRAQFSNACASDVPTAEATLTVLTSLQIWRIRQGLASDGSQDFASVSGDGVANILKFAFNMAPNAGDLNTSNVAKLPEGGIAGLPFTALDPQGRLVMTFVRRKAETNPGINYIVVTSDDLQTPQPLDLLSATVESLDSTWERVTVTDPTITASRFGAVGVTRE